jgi:hypothetical protein
MENTSGSWLVLCKCISLDFVQACGEHIAPCASNSDIEDIWEVPLLVLCLLDLRFQCIYSYFE